jgi:hypothetical protein
MRSSVWDGFRADEKQSLRNRAGLDSGPGAFAMGLFKRERGGLAWGELSKEPPGVS